MTKNEKLDEALVKVLEAALQEGDIDERIDNLLDEFIKEENGEIFKLNVSCLDGRILLQGSAGNAAAFYGIKKGLSPDELSDIFKNAMHAFSDAMCKGLNEHSKGEYKWESQKKESYKKRRFLKWEPIA